MIVFHELDPFRKADNKTLSKAFTRGQAWIYDANCYAGEVLAMAAARLRLTAHIRSILLFLKFLVLFRELYLALQFDVFGRNDDNPWHIVNSTHTIVICKQRARNILRVCIL